MAQDVCVLVNADDRVRLGAISGDRSRPHKHVLRARIILHSAGRLPVQEVARRAGVSRPSVWRWRRRFAELGADGLLREKSRVSGKAPLPRETVEHVVALTCSEPPGEATHWTGQAMAAAVGIGLARSNASGGRTACSPIASAPSSARRTRSSPPSCATSSGSTWSRRPTRSCCRSTKRARSRRSTAASRGCR